MKITGALLLLIGGFVHLIPALYNWLADLTGGTAWLQMIVGAASVVVALALFMGKESADETPPARSAGPGA